MLVRKVALLSSTKKSARRSEVRLTMLVKFLFNKEPFGADGHSPNVRAWCFRALIAYALRVIHTCRALYLAQRQQKISLLPLH